MCEDRIRVADIPPDGDHAVPGGEQRVVVRYHDRVMVDVDDPRGGDGVPGDLVHAGRGGQAAAQVEVLRDALLREEADRAEQERAVGQRQPPGVEPGFHQLLGRGPVDGEVVLAVQQVVVDPGDARPGDVDPVGHARLVLAGRARRRHEARPSPQPIAAKRTTSVPRGAAGPAARISRASAEKRSRSRGTAGQRHLGPGVVVARGVHHDARLRQVGQVELADGKAERAGPRMQVGQGTRLGLGDLVPGPELGELAAHAGQAADVLFPVRVADVPTVRGAQPGHHVADLRCRTRRTCRARSAR